MFINLYPSDNQTRWMNHFTIKDIENLSGIKAHTLRIWEQRYNFLAPKRKESLHRYYDNEDLKQILRISQLYHRGIKISKIAGLTDDAIRSMTMGQSEEKASSIILVHQMIEAAIDFDEPKFEKILDTAFKQLGFENTLIDVVYQFLERMGLLWLTDHIIPAQEHFSSNIIRRKMIVQIESLKESPSISDKVYVLFTLEGERHEIPLLLVYYLMKASGKRCIYMGIDLPFDDLVTYVKHKNPTHLYFHAIANVSDQPIEQHVATLVQLFPDQQILMSGPLTKEIKAPHSNLKVLYSLPEMIAYIKSIDDSP